MSKRQVRLARQAIAVDYWLDRERTYVASVDAELANEERLNINIHNPDAGEQKLYLYFAEVTHSDDIELTIHTDVDDVQDETPLAVSNNVIGSAETTAVDIAEVGAFDSLDTHSQQRYLGGGTEDVFDGYRVIVLPGEDILLEIESLSGGNNAGIRIAWIETPSALGTGLV